MKPLRTILAVALAFAPAASMAGETFDIDTAHSSVGFGVKHMVVSTVRGVFGEYSGSADVDMDDLTNSTVEVTIQAASIDTRQSDRDDHLRAPDFFDVENYPEITFKSSSIERDGDNFVAVGDLTMRGVTETVRMPIEVNGPIQDPWGNTRLGVSGTLTIDRTDFGLNYNSVLEAGGLVVGKDVDIVIDVELVKKSG